MPVASKYAHRPARALVLAFIGTHYYAETVIGLDTVGLERVPPDFEMVGLKMFKLAGGAGDRGRFLRRGSRDQRRGLVSGQERIICGEQRQFAGNNVVGILAHVMRDGLDANLHATAGLGGIEVAKFEK